MVSACFEYFIIASGLYVASTVTTKVGQVPSSMEAMALVQYQAIKVQEDVAYRRDASGTPAAHTLDRTHQLSGDHQNREVSAYIVGEDNANSCPDGFRKINHSDECQRAVAALGIASFNGEEFSDDNKPGGCWQGLSRAGNWNPNVGSAKSGTFPICKSKALDHPTEEVKEETDSSNPSKIAESAPLSEEGYQEVLAFRDNDAMTTFVQRIIDRYQGKIVVRSNFMGWIPFVSGDRASSSFNDLIRTLALADWLKGFQDASKVPLDEEGYQVILSMKNNDQMRAFVRRAIAKHGGKIDADEQPLFRFVENYSGVVATKSYDILIKDLLTVPWLSGFQPKPLPTYDPLRVLFASSDVSFFSLEEKGKHDELLFIGIFSAPRNFERRREVRESWMMDRIFHDGDRPKVRAKFIIGEIWPDQGEDFLDLKFAIEEENRMYGDIVEVGVHDTGEYRVDKSIAFLRWYSRTYCCVWEKHNYVLSLDENTWPNMNLILNFLRENIDDPSHNKYIGAMKWHRDVLREGEFQETANITDFPLSQYPVYALAGAYIVDMNLARKFDDDVETEGIVHLRDPETTIGNFLYQEDHVSMAVKYFDVEVNEGGCADTSYFLTNVCLGKMRCMWDKRIKKANETANFNEDICCTDDSCV